MKRSMNKLRRRAAVESVLCHIEIRSERLVLIPRNIHVSRFELYLGCVLPIKREIMQKATRLGFRVTEVRHDEVSGIDYFFDSPESVGREKNSDVEREA